MTSDNKTLIVADTGTDHLTAYDIDASDDLCGKRQWAEVPGCTPDGICLDAEGAVWIGSVFTGEFFRDAEGAGCWGA